MEEIVNFISTDKSSILIENIRNISLIVGSVIGLWLLWMRSRALKKQAEIAQNGYNHDRFTGYLELLESDNHNIRISAVQSLKLLIQEDNRYFWPIIKVFTIYANHNLPKEKKETTDTSTKNNRSIDRAIVQEMLKALGDEKIGWLPYYAANEVSGIDFLSNIIKGLFLVLTGQGEYRQYVDIFTQSQKNKWTLVFKRTNLSRMDIAGLFFPVAEFHICDLNKLYCTHSNLEFTRYIKCEMNDAKFLKSNLVNTLFNRCSLKNANFEGSDLNGAKFVNCDLTGVDFSKAKNHNKVNISNSKEQT